MPNNQPNHPLLDDLNVPFVRAEGVPARVQMPEAVPAYVPRPPRSNLLWIGVDLDGTIAEPVWTADNPTSDIGEPIWRNVKKLLEVVDAGYKVVIHTSRPWTDYENIEGWLQHYGIPFKSIQCGKPLYAVYADDRGRHAEDASWLPNPKEGS